MALSYIGQIIEEKKEAEKMDCELVQISFVRRFFLHKENNLIKAIRKGGEEQRRAFEEIARLAMVDAVSEEDKEKANFLIDSCASVEIL